MAQLVKYGAELEQAFGHSPCLYLSFLLLKKVEQLNRQKEVEIPAMMLDGPNDNDGVDVVFVGDLVADQIGERQVRAHRHANS